MVEKEVAITYETLYELLRREKSREELQEIPESFFSDVIEYIRSKRAVIDSKKGDPFSDEEAEKTAMQLGNVRKILKELYDRREKKIINMAINKARTKSGIIDTSSLLAEEKLIFDNITSLLNNYRHLILTNILQGEPVVITGFSGIKRKSKEEIKFDNSIEDDEDLLQGTTAPFNQISDGLSELKTGSLSSADDEIKVKVVFTKEVPEFIGTDLENYGPYKKDDSAMLPLSIVNLLINNQQAKKEIVQDNRGSVENPDGNVPTIEFDPDE